MQTHFRTIVFIGSVAKHKAALLLDMESGSLKSIRACPSWARQEGGTIKGLPRPQRGRSHLYFPLAPSLSMREIIVWPIISCVVRKCNKG